MSQNNKDETTIIAMAFAFVGAVAMAMAFFIAAILAFVAFIFTILAIIAWKEPLRLGKFSIEPAEAQAFVYRGLFGAVIVPVFLLFCVVLFGIPIEWDYLTYFILGGYVAGSVGVEIALAEANGNMSAQAQMPDALPPQPAQRTVPAIEREPFRYASWDDEEETGR